MMAKIKYPLTHEAKEAAKSLVQAWEKGGIDQYFEMIDATSGNASNRELFLTLGGHGYSDTPSLGILLELAQFKLLVITPYGDTGTHLNYNVVLMQELRNAVVNDFDVSDFFLTTQAVGTIINAAENSSVTLPGLQNAASVYGDIEQTQISTPNELAVKLLQLLDPSILQSHPQLEQAIKDLTTVEKPNKRQFGSVISELGRCLQDVANTAVVIQALYLLFQFLYNNRIL